MALIDEAGFRQNEPEASRLPKLLAILTHLIAAELITLDAGIAALAAFNTNGIIVQTANNTYAGRTLAAPATGLTITNPAGTAGNPTFALANDLAALEGLASTGFGVRSATDTWVQRSLVAPATGLTISNNDGVGGNPTFALANDLAAVEALASTGIARRTGTDAWSVGTTVSVAEGGTGVTTSTGTGNTVLSASPTFTGTAIFAGATFSGFTGLNGGASVTGTTAPSSGQNIELSHNGTVGIILSYDRTGAAYKQLSLRGSVLDVTLSGVQIIGATSTGVDIAGEMRCDTFRIDAAPSVSVATPSTHKLSFSANGTTYYFLVSNV